MKLKLFTIYDRAVGTHSALLLAVNEATAGRQIYNMAKNPNSQFKEFGNDYELYEVGEFNDEDAVLDNKPKRKVGTIEQVLNSLFERAPDEKEQGKVSHIQG